MTQTTLLAAPKRMVELTVDGEAVRVLDGSTILDACRMLGVDTPTLCYGDTLTPVNVCRVCVVELEGSRTLVPACSRKAEEGMVVRTDSERVRLTTARARAARLVCRPLDRAGGTRVHRPLRRRSGALRPGRSDGRAAREDRQRPLRARLLEVHPLLQVRRGLRRASQNTFAIAVAGRGFGAHISTELDVALPDSACVYCGNCIAVCPTGALMSKAEYDMRAGGTWDPENETVDRPSAPTAASAAT